MPLRGRWVWLGALALVVAGAAAYSNSLDGQFLFDDPEAIPNNRSIRALWPPFQPLLPPADTTVSARPLVNLTLAVNYAFGGLDVRGYHAFNVAVHVLAALTLMGVVRRTLAGGCRSTGILPVSTRGVPPLGHRKNDDPEAHATTGGRAFGTALARYATPLALIVAMVWMLHPVQTEAVAYVVQRTESVMGLLFLLTLYCAIRGFESNRRGWFVAAVACCAMGMASKEVMVAAPLLVLLYDRALAAGSWRAALRARWRFYLTLAATWGVLAACIAGGTRAMTGFDLGASSLDYLKTQAGVILHYLRLSVWPDPLILDYDWPFAKSFWQYAPQGAAILALLAATAAGLWRNRPWALPGAWFFLILAPSSSFIPLPTMLVVEHRMYLSLAAVVCVAVLGVVRLGDYEPVRITFFRVAGLLSRHLKTAMPSHVRGGTGAPPRCYSAAAPTSPRPTPTRARS